MMAFILWACSSSNPEVSNRSDSKTRAVQNVQPVRSKAPAQPSEKEASVKGIRFEGTVAYSGTQKGSMELEVLDNSTGEPRLLGRQTVSEDGTFSIGVVPDSESLTLMAYLDLTGNSISDDDPRGYLQIDNVSNNLDGLKITILDLDALEIMKSTKTDKPKEASKEKH